MFGRLCQIKWHSHRATVHKLIAVKSASGQTTVGIDPQVMPRSGGMAIFRGCVKELLLIGHVTLQTSTVGMMESKDIQICEAYGPVRGFPNLCHSVQQLFVVVKVNGFTHFKKKRNSIVAFGSGYSNSSNDQNPIVYIEDTTRKAHK
ncbi:hypothetical protein YC2023_066778 [Brassica napus]